MSIPHFYRPELDGLRFFAFLAVFARHAFPEDPAALTSSGVPHPFAVALSMAARCGAYGVDLFFVLSAFLITEILLREHEARGAIDARAFLVRRALRIWPLFFAFLALSVFADRFVLHRAGLSKSDLGAFAGLAGNWACALFGTPDSVAAPLWSVSVEEQFYLAWPLVFAMLGPRSLRPVCVAVFGVAAASRVVTVLAGAGTDGVYYSTLCRLDAFAVGALLAVVLRNRRTPWAPRGAVRILLIVGGLALWGAGQLEHSVAGNLLLGVTLLYPLAYIGAAWIFLGALGDATGPVRMLASPRLVYLGRISYGLYVFHALAVDVAVRFLRPRLGFAPRVSSVLLALVATVALAALSHRFLERPFLSLKRRFTIVPSGGD